MASASQHGYVDVKESADMLDGAWLIRPCEMYKDEFEECSSYKARWNQRYIYGENQDCSKWKENYEDCIALHKTRSAEFAAKIIESERERIAERELQKKINDVWEYRTAPPREWSAPLPENLTRKAVPETSDRIDSNKTCTVS